MKRFYFIPLIIILTIFSTLTPFIVISHKSRQEVQNFPSSSFPMDLAFNQYENHDPITINGNTDFRNQAIDEKWLGNGTTSDPYIIGGLSIIGNNSGDLIRISNTDLHFRIDNCFLFGGYNGISLYNFNTGDITNSIIINNIDGLYLSSSANTTVINNTIADNIHHGIRFTSIADSTVVNNTIINNYWAAVSLTSSVNCTLANNTIASNDGYGIRLNSSNFSLIFDNNISDNNWGGIRVDYSTNNTISNNIIFNNKGVGVSLIISDYGNVANNTIMNNYGYGVHLNFSNFSLLLSNNVSDNNLTLPELNSNTR
ncbi:MAG: right-handed parallel beta-helix repeat-containing protein [Candidatus Hodarchaeota archaeon]